MPRQERCPPRPPSGCLHPTAPPPLHFARPAHLPQHAVAKREAEAGSSDEEGKAPKKALEDMSIDEFMAGGFLEAVPGGGGGGDSQDDASDGEGRSGGEGLQQEGATNDGSMPCGASCAGLPGRQVPAGRQLGTGW